MRQFSILSVLVAITSCVSLAGTITGTVTDDSTGLPIGGVWVNAYDYSTGFYYMSSLTNSDGFYSISGLAAGIYQIGVSVWGSGYIEEYYDNIFDFSKASPVAVNATDVVENIDFQLSLGGSICGMVKDSNGEPLAGIQVSCYDYNGGYGFSDMTDSDGMYEITQLTSGVYQVDAWATNTVYVSKLYDNKVFWDQPTPVSVTLGQKTTGIDFMLDLAASISGVVKDPDGQALANVQIYCGVNGWWESLSTDENGCYVCRGLPVGYTYNIIAFPPENSGYAATVITVQVNQPDESTGHDIVFNEDDRTISGRITDKATGLPLANIYVGSWNDQFEIWTDTTTDSNGYYTLTGLLPGQVSVEVEPESYYAYMGTKDLQLETDISNLDFALPAGSTLSGKVIDAQTARPLAGVRVEYSNNAYAAWQDLTTDADGSFYLTQLPPGIAEIKAEPTVESCYAWNLPWGCDWIYLGEGETCSGRIIALQKGALVSGYFKNAGGTPFGNFEYNYHGKPSEGWGETAVDGLYQIRLPVGMYYLSTGNNDTFGAVPAIITVTNINETINVPDIIVYTDTDGGHISGTVNNPGNTPKVGDFMFVVFKAGTILNDPEKWDTIQPAAVLRLNNAGPFSLNTLPVGVNYDIYLCLDNGSDDIEALAIRDSAMNVAAGSTGIELNYNSQGSTLAGSVKNADNVPVVGATVILWGLPGFSGFTRTVGNGHYQIDNVPAGTYTVTALHSAYLLASTTINVIEGQAANVSTLVLPFSGIKEGPDLNGDGKVNMGDLAVFAAQWLHSGTNPADFNQDNQVNLYDWSPIAENWLSKAIWYHD
jgi:hypothetical protein